jgi:hypothetical protein
MADEHPSEPKVKVTIWEFLRDVLIAGMNRGQLLGITLSLALIIFVIRAPTNDLLSFGREILQAFREYYLVGYGLFGLSILGWREHARQLRARVEDELKRTAEERNRLQQRELGGLLESSNLAENEEN